MRDGITQWWAVRRRVWLFLIKLPFKAAGWRPVAGIGLLQIEPAGLAHRRDPQEALEQLALSAVRAAAAKPHQQRMGASQCGCAPNVT